MIRVSCTAVEAVRLYLDPSQDWFTAQALDAQIAGTEPTSPAAALGTAFGKVMEHGPSLFSAQHDAFLADGFEFDFHSTDDALERWDRRGLFEVKGTKAYGDVLVVAKADQLFGAQLVEGKATLNAFDFEKYAHSVQWRLMADIFQPSVVTYRVALLGEVGAGRYEVREVAEFNLYPYAGLSRDCEKAVDDFRHYVTTRGLATALRARQARIEAA